MLHENYRPRLSIVIDEDIMRELNSLLGEWRIKNRLYVQLTKDLIRVMKAMTPQQRRIFLVAILEEEISLETYSPLIKKVLREGE